MDLTQLATILGVVAGITAIAGVVFVGVKVKANEAALVAQREFIDVQARDIVDLKGKLDSATKEIRSLTQENATLLAAVTQRAEVAALHEAEDQHHAETIAVLLRIEKALRRD